MKKILIPSLLAIAAWGAWTLAAAQPQDKIRIGFIAAMSGPLSSVGAEQKRGLDLALEHLGNKVGGVPVEVVAGDTKTNPGATVQDLSRLLEKEKVDVVTGLTTSAEILAAIKPVTDARTILIGTNGGPVQLSGEGCSPWYFSAAFQNTQVTEGVGAFMSQKGVKKVYMLGLDYEAGREHLAAAKKGFKGEIVGENYTPMAQADFAGDIARVRASGADAVFAFYGGGPAVSFVRQWAQAGMGKLPLYSNFALADPLTLPGQGKGAKGISITGIYFADLDNPENKRFVDAFRAKYSRDPSAYAAQQYDAVMLIDAAARELKGNIRNPDAFRAALAKANFKSVRGPFRFNNNHMPIQNTYIAEIDERADGTMYLKPGGIVAENARDEFASKCAMK
ncbi:MAG: transporter substrate-binding protein [Ramlibacter sp.]|nr:transporter substrate-binding protein [Ramlibacter sp.]